MKKYKDYIDEVLYVLGSLSLCLIILSFFIKDSLVSSIFYDSRIYLLGIFLLRPIVQYFKAKK